MTIFFRRCANDEELAKVSLFALANKREMHAALGTLDMVSQLVSYMTHGHLLYLADDEDQVVGIIAYYHGTPEQEFKNKEVAFVDAAILGQAYRGTRIFIRGLRYMVDAIIEAHPDVQELRFIAFAENTYLCRLYAKFSKISSTREGPFGKETVFSVKIHNLRATLNEPRLV
ncbi:hypothetical protein B5M42_006820 [Paenibacillus athensensis]|uniref:N-acetyltransferase domain-containing protein n=1 Tax=Paenibacillus athensensis TaxID=1967502 RepID=A0A4Y8Q0B9_9BACL|nr:hypothetical protein [Paenibacillus athensensis]MCD1258544.1 hypothetical protein [Paenibacillus athensensis]